MPLLFSYGTLQLRTSAIRNFWQIAEKVKKSILEGYQLTMIEITDAEVLRKSNQQFHPIISFSGDKKTKWKADFLK